MTQTTNKMTFKEAIEFSVAEGFTMSQHDFYQKTRIFGDYFFNSYKRAVNKELKAKQTQANEVFVKENTALVELLKSETENLRVEYLAKMRDWSLAEFARLTALVEEYSYTIPNNATRYALVTKEQVADSVQRRKLTDKIHSLIRVIEAGETAFVAREQRLAQMHYEDSILKLASRIEKKDLNQSKLSVKSARLKMNFETVISDGEKSVRAFTILAYGPVQRPHYRYLVK